MAGPTSHTYQGAEIIIQQMDVGASYHVPSIFDYARRANNVDHALEMAKEDIDTGGTAHEWRSSEKNSGGPEHIFGLKMRIAELEAKVSSSASAK